MIKKEIPIVGAPGEEVSEKWSVFSVHFQKNWSVFESVFSKFWSALHTATLFLLFSCVWTIFFADIAYDGRLW